MSIEDKFLLECEEIITNYIREDIFKIADNYLKCRVSCSYCYLSKFNTMTNTNICSNIRYKYVLKHLPEELL